MGLFINKWSPREGMGSKKGFSKVRGLVPGDRGLCREEPCRGAVMVVCASQSAGPGSLSEQECPACFQVISGVGRRAGSAGLGASRFLPAVSLPL